LHEVEVVGELDAAREEIEGMRVCERSSPLSLEGVNAVAEGDLAISSE
jgi:hypothetical protein